MSRRKKISQWLKKRAAKSSIGISMLDVISNALAGTMCLFFALSAIQAVPPEAPRIIGKLVVTLRLEPLNHGVSLPALFLKAPKTQNPDSWFPTLYESDMLRINFDYDTITDYRTDNFLPFNVYRNPNDSLQYEFHFTNPRQGEYEFGAIYTDHARFLCDAQPVRFHFQAHFHKTDTDQTFSTGDSTVVLNYPTETCSFVIEPPMETQTN
jgi:hypothetical protein